jgi:hypothetical protein
MLIDETQLKGLAAAIAPNLFTNGGGECVRWLGFELPDGSNDGGWSQHTVEDYIQLTIMGHFGMMPPTKIDRRKKMRGVS